jgi:3-oxoacyl-[acyl-carrier-protein] synthase-1
MTLSRHPVAIVNAGLVTSVGLSAAASCAAIRAGLTNHTETRFIDGSDEWIPGAQVVLDQPWCGREKLGQMLRLAIDECLEPFPDLRQRKLPVLLCLAEQDRHGRLAGLDELLDDVAARLPMVWDPEHSGVITYGRVGVAVALARARTLIHERGVDRVIVAAADSLLLAATLDALDKEGRLLSATNSNGFIPGEGAGAVLLSKRLGPEPQLTYVGLGFGTEAATVTSDDPLRGDGLTAAIGNSLVDAGHQMHDIDFRITDNSGEQYYFKEGALALARTMRERVKTEFDIWHPADCIGETGSTVGVVALAVALAACRKAYAAGPHILFHSGNDAGHRAAVILRYGAMA